MIYPDAEVGDRVRVVNNAGWFDVVGAEVVADVRFLRVERSGVERTVPQSCVRGLARKGERLP